MEHIARRQADHRNGVAALVVLALVFASMGLFARYLSTGFSLLQQVYLRVLAALVLGIFAFRNNLDFGKIRRVPLREWGILLFRAAASYLFGVTLFTQAILLTKYSNVSFIGALPLVALFGVVLFRERLTVRKISLIAMAFAGVVLIAVKDYSHLLVWGKGEAAALLSTIAFSLSYVARKWHSDLLNNREITQLIFLLAFFMIFVTSLVFGEGLPVHGWTAGLLLAVLGAGAFNVVNMFLTNYGFQKVEAILASNILTLESVFAVILGIFFYAEIPTLKEIAGGLAIIVSVIGMNQAEAAE